MNRCSKKAIALWYSTKGPVEVARECLQVRTRGGWSHRDVIHMSHLSFADPGWHWLFVFTCYLFMHGVSTSFIFNFFLLSDILLLVVMTIIIMIIIYYYLYIIIT